MKLAKLSIALGIGLSINCQARAQDTAVVPVDVTIIVPPPPATQVVVPTTTINTISRGATINTSSLSLPSFGAEICDGLGDPLQLGINRFENLIEQRDQATSQSEIERLDREIVLQGLKLPDLVREDLLNRQDFNRDSPECDELINNLVELMEQVADYLGALKEAKTAILW